MKNNSSENILNFFASDKKDSALSSKEYVLSVKPVSVESLNTNKKANCLEAIQQSSFKMKKSDVLATPGKDSNKKVVNHEVKMRGLSLKKRNHTPETVSPPVNTFQEVSFDSFLSALNSDSKKIDIVYSFDNIIAHDSKSDSGKAEINLLVESEDKDVEFISKNDEAKECVISLPVTNKKSPKAFDFLRWRSPILEEKSDKSVAGCASGKNHHVTPKNKDNKSKAAVADCTEVSFIDFTQELEESTASSSEPTSQSDQKTALSVSISSTSGLTHDFEPNEPDTDCEVLSMKKQIPLNSDDVNLNVNRLQPTKNSGVASIFDSSTWGKKSAEKVKPVEGKIISSPVRMRVRSNKDDKTPKHGRTPKQPKTIDTHTDEQNLKFRRKSSEITSISPLNVDIVNGNENKMCDNESTSEMANTFVDSINIDKEKGEDNFYETVNSEIKMDINAIPESRPISKRRGKPFKANSLKLKVTGVFSPSKWAKKSLNKKKDSDSCSESQSEPTPRRSLRRQEQQKRQVEDVSFIRETIRCSKAAEPLVSDEETIEAVLVEKDAAKEKSKRKVEVPSIFDPTTWSKKAGQKQQETLPVDEDNDDDCCIISKEQTPMDPDKLNFLRSGLPASLQRSLIESIGAVQTATPAPLPKISHVTNRSELEESWLQKMYSETIKFPSLKEDKVQDEITFDPTYKLSRDVSASNDCLYLLVQMEKITKADWQNLIVTIKEDSPGFPVNRFLNAFQEQRKEATGKSEDIAPKVKEVSTVAAKSRSLRRRQSEKVATVDNAKDLQLIEDTPTACPLWCDKYAPATSANFLGNMGKLRRVKEWLESWRVAMDRELKKLLKQQKKERAKARKAGTLVVEDSDDEFQLSDSSTLDSQSSEPEEFGLAHTFLISGPHGSGKTSLAFALANQLGYKVFEVNASSRRTCKDILAHLQEAVESKHVAKDNLSKVFSTFHMTQNMQTSPVPKSRKRKRDSQDFFSPKAKKPRQLPNSATKKAVDSSRDKSAIEKKGLNLTSCSLVLFDEVDVVFEEDKGFWSAVTTLMQLNKRPIIMTTRDPHFLQKMGGVPGVEHCILSSPPPFLLAGYLRTILLLEGWKAPLAPLLRLATSCHGDIRRAVNTLQLCVYGISTGSAAEDSTVASVPFFLPSQMSSDDLQLDRNFRNSFAPVRGVNRSVPLAPTTSVAPSVDCSLSEIFTTGASPTTNSKEESTSSQDVDSKAKKEDDDLVPLSPEEVISCEATLPVYSDYLESLSRLDGLLVWQRPEDRYLGLVTPSCSEEGPLLSSSTGTANLNDGEEGEIMRQLWSRHWTTRLKETRGIFSEEVREAGEKMNQVSSFEETDCSRLTGCHEDVLRNMPLTNRLNGRTLSMDNIPFLRRIAKIEAMKRITSHKRRFFHYFDKIAFNIKDSTLDSLCQDFK